jgi:hypothetical protein
MDKLFRKFIIWITVVTLFFSPILNTEVLAQDTEVHNFEKANQLKAIGLLHGNDEGFSLDKEVTKIEAAVMIVRLLGKESLAKQEKFSHNFIDVPQWANDYVGYLYAKRLCKGTNDTLFGSENKMTLSQYLIWALRSLGYNDSKGDFDLTKAIDKAREIGLVHEDEISRIINRNKFIRDDMIGISFNALSARMKDSDKILIDRLTENSQGYTVIAEAISDDVIELVFDDINVSPWMTIYSKHENNYKYGCKYKEEYNVQPKLEIISSKTHIKFENLDWAKSDSYEVYFKAGNKLHNYSLNENDKGKVIEIEDNKEYGTLEVSLPFAKKNHTIGDIEIHSVPDDMESCYSIKVGTFEYTNVLDLPVGTYNIHVNAYDNENVYSLFKKNCVIKSGKNLVTFSKEEIAQIKLNIDYRNYKNMKLLIMSSSSNDGFSSIRSLSYGDFKKVTNLKSFYITKINNSIGIDIGSEDGWSYSLDTKLDDAVDCLINFDLNLKAEIDLDKETYLPSEVLVEKFHISDSYGNNMSIIYNPNGEFVGATIEFTKGKDKKTIHLDNLGYTRIELPIASGEYTMKITVDEGPIKIKPISKQIIIKK